MNTVPPSNGPVLVLLTVSVVTVTLTVLGSTANEVQQIIATLVSLVALYLGKGPGQDAR